MNKDDKKRKIEDLENLYNEAMSLNGVNLPDDIEMEHVELYDYEKDIQDTKNEGNLVVDSMVDLYLGNHPKVLDHSYIKKKKEHDATNQAEMLFLKKMALRALIIQLKQMDSGDTSHRNFETFYAGLREIREILKQASATGNLQEKFYKELKQDLGITDQPTIVEESKTENGNITDQKSLNDTIRDIMEKRKNDGNE